MDINKFRKEIEKPSYNNVEEVFEKAGLNKQEREILINYKKYCEWWLLRIKTPLINNFGDVPNTLSLIARGLINLNHPRVSGKVKRFVKEMFGDNAMHLVYETITGFRSTRKSQKIPSSLFEMDVMSFFLNQGYYIEICGNKKIGKKIPEFIASKDRIKFTVEAKYLNFDSLLNNVFGDEFVEGFDYKPSNKEILKGYEKNLQILERNYRKAIKKMDNFDIGEYFIVFINIHDFYEMGANLNNYLFDITESWEEIKFKQLSGLVLTGGKTELIINPFCKIDIRKTIPDIEEFNDYEIEIVE